MNNAEPGTQITTGPDGCAQPGLDPADGTLPLSDPLAGLKAEFPAFRIWRESLCGHVRYIARSLHQGLNPHTVVTADPDELRAALAPSRPAGLAAAGLDAQNVQAATRLRLQRPSWVIVWSAPLRQFSASPLFRAPRATHLNAPTISALAALMDQAEQAARRRPARPRAMDG
jgi:hypothetical protein